MRHPHGLRAAAGNRPIVTFLAGSADTADLTTYTFTDVADPGASNNSKRIYVVIQGTSSANRTISSVTVTPSGGAGITATEINKNTTGSLAPRGLFACDYTGTATLTVSVTFSGGATSCAIGVYKVINQTSALGSVLVQAVNNSSVISVTTISASNLATNPLGFVIVCGGVTSARDITETNWTEDFPTGSSGVHLGLGKSTGLTTTYTMAWTSGTTAVITAYAMKP